MLKSREKRVESSRLHDQHDGVSGAADAENRNGSVFQYLGAFDLRQGEASKASIFGHIHSLDLREVAEVTGTTFGRLSGVSGASGGSPPDILADFASRYRQPKAMAHPDLEEIAKASTASKA